MKAFLIICSLFITLFIAQPDLVHAAGISQQKAAAIAKSRYPGRIIGVNETNSGSAYRVKILDKNGGVHIVVIDKQTGNILSAH